METEEKEKNRFSVSEVKITISFASLSEERELVHSFFVDSSCQQALLFSPVLSL